MRFGLSLLVVLLCSSNAFAQHAGDIEIGLEGGQLVVEPGDEGWLFESEFPQSPDPLAYFTDEPGFEADDGVLDAGEELSVELLSGLLFWNGASVGAAPAGTALAIDQGPARLASLTGAGPLNAFVLGSADDEGGLHAHLDFLLLQENGATPPVLEPGGPLGVFGLHLRLTSPQHGASQPLLIAFNNGLPDDDFAAAAEALAAHAGVPVPEPATALLASLGVTIAAAGWRLVSRPRAAARSTAAMP
jgi:hypothetical protein